MFLREIQTYQSNILSPSSGSRSKQSQKPAEAEGQSREPCLLLIASCLDYSSTLKLEVICFSETSGSVPTTRRSNPEDHTLHNHPRENLKSSSLLWNSGVHYRLHKSQRLVSIRSHLNPSSILHL